MKIILTKIYLFILLNCLALSQAHSETCHGMSILTVNGDNGYGDNCEFYHDVSRVNKAFTQSNCKQSIVPTKSNIDGEISH